MNTTTFQAVNRLDYKVPDFLVDTVELCFNLEETETRVRSTMRMRKNPAQSTQSRTLALYGEKLELTDIAMDGRELEPGRWRRTPDQLMIDDVPDSFVMEIGTLINPAENTALSGLYLSENIFCSQCEAEGFRRLTYYPDRPDVLARFTTRIEADAGSCPTLLSNGNLIESGTMSGGKHFAVWQDPFPKPSYLFALVAGRLVCIEDAFSTASGRRVALQIYVQSRNEHKCDHAMRSLKKAMKWDEQVFGLEYDLDRYMIVAVDDFNMGAMENKGLNIFNSKYVLASQESATDQDFLAIEGVIGHEYFHNWTGNRVTCRDWFQLSLKEGLTVFRDQEFSADMNSRSVQRIDDVRLLRQFQFREDAGPMAHPVRPDSYLEINNFYTVTVYNKGAEVVRMLHTLVGPDLFRQGMDLYISRHDGQAVTCDDFAAAMSDASSRDLEQFQRWYSQAGTPQLSISDQFEPATGTYLLTISQTTPPTPGQPEKQPFHIPILIGLLDGRGEDMASDIACDYTRRGRSILLELTEEHQTFTFTAVPERPVLSVLRNFSAPVKIEPFHDMDECIFLMQHDSDAFNRWDAAFSMSERLIIDLAADLRSGSRPRLDSRYIAAMRHNLVSGPADHSLLALALQLPSEGHLAQVMEQVEPTSLHLAHQYVKQELARNLQEDLLEMYRRCNTSTAYQFAPEQIGRRDLVAVCLGYLAAAADEQPELEELCRQHYLQAGNMTDSFAALSALVHLKVPTREALLDHFEKTWSHDPLVMDKWFALQASSQAEDTYDRVVELMGHRSFSLKTPNKVRALVSTFSQNHYHFHHESGRGYRFLSEVIERIDPLNPQIAARLVTPLVSWKRYDAKRQQLMRTELERIGSIDSLSRDVFEVVKRSLE